MFPLSTLTQTELFIAEGLIKRADAKYLAALNTGEKISNPIENLSVNGAKVLKDLPNDKEQSEVISRLLIDALAFTFQSFEENSRLADELEKISHELEQLKQSLNQSKSVGVAEPSLDEVEVLSPEVQE